jgi:SAM-dependent methyltransferase
VTSYRGIALRYDAEITRLPPALRGAFVDLDADDSTRAWIDAALVRPRPHARIALRMLATAFVSIYDANGLTNTGQSRVLGTAQWRRLLGAGGSRLLDVGAGEGGVTRELGALFTDVVTTELSPPLARRLRSKGFTCHQCDLASQAIDDSGNFDVVALQNVIDRTSHPLRLLDRVAQLLARGGRVIVTVPVPIEPVVFKGASRFSPAEMLPVGMPDFESTVAALYTEVFEPRGYRIAALARAPYFCDDAVCSPIRVRDDAIFVLTHRTQSQY